MKRHIIRALTVGAALLVPATGLTVLGTGTAGAVTTHKIGATLTFTTGGIISTVKFSGTYTLSTKATWDTASWTGTGTAAAPYKDVASTALAGKTTFGTTVTITDAAGNEIIVILNTKVTFTTTVQFVVVKGGTTCGIIFNANVVFPHAGTGKKYSLALPLNTIAATVKHLHGSGTACTTIATNLHRTGAIFSGTVQFT